MRKALAVDKASYFSVLTNKGVCSRAAGKWEKMLVPNNCILLKGKEGLYPYCAFDVEGHPEQKHKLIPIPSDVAIKVFPKIYADAQENPSKYGLKLDDSDADVRARHQQRLNIFLWKPEDCAKPDADGKLKPCLISPPLNSWAQCPTLSQIPNLGKELTEAASSDQQKTKSSGASKSKSSEKRKLFASEADHNSNGVKVVPVDENMLDGIDKIIRIDKFGSPHTVCEQNGVLFITLFKGGSGGSGGSGGPGGPGGSGGSRGSSSRKARRTNASFSMDNNGMGDAENDDENNENGDENGDENNEDDEDNEDNDDDEEDDDNNED
ncbi:hypothetical protein N9S81_00225 [bacterium]|nr:hypothetical protein [bacterium]